VVEKNMMNKGPVRRAALVSLLATVLGACGGGGGGGEGGGGGGGEAPAASAQPVTYTIGGTVTGLSNSGLVLLNGKDRVALPATATGFTFPTSLQSAAGYAVTVGTQPTGQTCTVANGSGIVAAAAITNVQVTCTSSMVSLGGQVTGLRADGLSLSNGTETLTLSRTQVAFTFQALVPVGSPFEVVVTSQPALQTCTVTPSSGTLPARAVDLLVVDCTDALAAGAEPLPDLNAPQPGSAADRKLPLVGIYRSNVGQMVVSPDLQTMLRPVVGLVSGSVSVTDTAWTYLDGATENFLTADPVAGAGTFVQGKSIAGSVTYPLEPARSSTSFAMEYNVANALAVTQGSLQGTWVLGNGNGNEARVTIDANGNVAGTSTGTTFGDCVLAGDIKLADPAGSINVFKQTLVGTGGACRLQAGVPYVGLSAIMFTPAGSFVGNGYYRQIVFWGVTSSGSFVVMPVTRQP
jgi:hypothetical protein